MTYHPAGSQSSSTVLHGEDWLDFNMIQSGHSRTQPAGWEHVAHDRALAPVKPTLDGEPCYEDHPVEMNPARGWFDASDVRRAAYAAVFAGALGHTYGAHGTWQMFAGGRMPVSHARTSWQASLTLPFASQLRHLRRLLLAYDFAHLGPDVNAVVEPGTGRKRVGVLRGSGQRLAYLPYGRAVTFREAGGAASWFDPRTGEYHPAVGTRSFEAPSRYDWVLVLEDGV